MGFSPWGRKESDTTERLHFHFLSLALLVGAQTWVTVILNGLPWKRTEIILLFLRVHPTTTFQTFVDQEGYSISFKRFLPTIVDITVI